MTRCYEYYCMYKSLPDKCDLSPVGECYVSQYMDLLGCLGLAFNKEAKDKELFTMVNTPERVLRPLFDESDLMVRANAEREIISILEARKNDARGSRKLTTKFLKRLLDDSHDNKWKSEIYVVRGDYPFQFVTIQDIESGRKLTLNQMEFIEWLEFERELPWEGI